MTKMTGDEIHSARKDFFNSHAAGWCDAFYKDQETGRYDRHARDFERLFSILQLKAGDSVLDAGCGTGVLVPSILESITSTGILYELDYADRMLEVNRSLHCADNIRYVLAEAENAPLPDTSCDAVVCFSCFPHLHDMKKAMTTFSRVLKPGGLLAISHFASSDGIKKHHESCHAVMHDRLPESTAMRALFETAGLGVDRFIDEPGFYYVSGRKNQ